MISIKNIIYSKKSLCYFLHFIRTNIIIKAITKLFEVEQRGKRNMDSLEMVKKYVCKVEASKLVAVSS